MAKQDRQTTKRAAPIKAARKTAKPVKSAKPLKAAKAIKPQADLKQITGEVQALKKERDNLRAELSAAKQRITDLEAINENAVNRIDWVLDSLHTLLENSQ